MDAQLNIGNGDQNSQEARETGKKSVQEITEEEIDDRSKKLAELEARGEDRYRQAKLFYRIWSLRKSIERSQKNLQRLRRCDGTVEPLPKKDEKEYVPEEVLHLLSHIPDAGYFTDTLKEIIISSFYFINVRYRQAKEELAGAKAARTKYLVAKGLEDDAEEEKFWSTANAEIDETRARNEELAKEMIEKAEGYKDRKLTDSEYNALGDNLGCTFPKADLMRMPQGYLISGDGVEKWGL